MRNSRLPVPKQEGVDYVPTTGVPYDWPLELTPSTKYIDMLADPEAQAMSVENAITQIRKELMTWMAIIPQVDDDEIKKDADAMQKALDAYGSAQSELIKTYFSNTVEAVKMFCDIMESRGKGISSVESEDEQADITNGINDLASSLTKSNGGESKEVDWDMIKDIADKVGEGNDLLVDKQHSLVETGQKLAGAAQKFLQNEAHRTKFGWLNGYVGQLTAKLETLREQFRRSQSASNVYYENLKYAEAHGDDDPNDERPVSLNPNERSSFGLNSFPSELDSPQQPRWTSVTIKIDQSQLRASSDTNTYFAASQWGVDLFLGSGGGSTQESGTDFAEEFMTAESEIQIGFLAAKVLIERPWMKPEVFAHTKNFFRTMKKPLSPDSQMTHEQLTGQGGESELLKLINDNAFPAYPVAVLLAKDICVKVKFDESKSERLRKTRNPSRAKAVVFSASASRIRNPPIRKTKA